MSAVVGWACLCMAGFCAGYALLLTAGAPDELAFIGGLAAEWAIYRVRLAPAMDAWIDSIEE